MGAVVNQDVATEGGSCSWAQLKTSLSVLEQYISKFEAVKTEMMFSSMLSSFSIIPMLDGLQGCMGLLENMLTTNEIEMFMPGERRVCNTTRNDPGWSSDPCCNANLAFTKCCGLRAVRQNVTVITSVRPADVCDSSKSGILGNALMGYSMAHQIRSDPVAGCTAVRKDKVNRKKMKHLYKFMDTCYDILFHGKTKAGLAECKSDSECYTGRCGQQSAYSYGGASGKRTCQLPMEDFEGPFAACALDNIDPTLLNWLRKKLGVSSKDPIDLLKQKIYDAYAEETCVGPGADDAVCIFDATKDECENNIFNLYKSYENQPETSVQKLWIYVDDNMSDQAACNANAGRRWHDQFGCVCASDSSTRKSHDEGPGSSCRKQELNYAEIEGLREVNDWNGRNDLETNFLDTSPDSARKCRILNIQMLFSYTNTSAQICDAWSKAFKHINGWQTTPAVAADYVTFAPSYKWEWREDGTFERVKTGNGSKTWCEFEKNCNHKPWDSSAGTQESCVDPYVTGPLRSRGEFFCAQCDGPWCWETSVQSQCLYAHAWDRETCAVSGGLWIPEDTYGWGTCAVDARANHTAETCFGRFCPVTTETWTDSWSGTQHSWTSYGFCESYYVCYDEPESISKDACNAMRKEGEDFPMWYTNDVAALNAAGSPQLFIPKEAMCVYWAGGDMSYMGSWYSEVYGEEEMPNSTRATCGRKWMSPRYYEEGRFNSQATCEAGVCSSAPWDWNLAKDPAKCTEIGGVCSRTCKACESMTDEQEFCIVTSISTQRECENKTNDLLWDSISKTCYGTRKRHRHCFKRADSVALSCRLLGSENCTQRGVNWQNNPLFNGKLWSQSSGMFGLDCFTNNYGRCQSEAECVSGGSCNDWTYESWYSPYDYGPMPDGINGGSGSGGVGGDGGSDCPLPRTTCSLPITACRLIGTTILPPTHDNLPPT
jgi:hypothetical protein